MNSTKYIGTLGNAALFPVSIMSTMADYDGEAALREAGVVFYAPLADHPHLRLVELPDGWKLVEIATSRYPRYRLNLLDDKGRVRARMWQRRLFNSRQIRAEMKVACPFIISFRGERENNLVVRVRLRYGGEIKAMEPARIKAIKNRHGLGKFKVEKVDSMKQWLDESLPGWRNNPKYWDYQKVA